MKTDVDEQHAVESIVISHEIEISAPIETAFAAMLDELGPMSLGGDGKPMPMVLEARPGGRWYRDLGDDAGHLWGHVQVIKPPMLLEICGPLMMPYPAINHVQYRFKSDAGVTRLTFLHRALGSITPDHRDGMPKGWAQWLGRIRDLAETRSRQAVHH